MSLAVRVIPILLRRGASLVKGQQFDAWRSIGHPLQAAKIHAARAVDELCYLDIEATPKGRGPDLALVEQLTKEAFIPVTVGGGVRTVRDVENLLRAGADKILICSHANEVLSMASQRFGKQALVAGLDVSGNRVAFACGQESTRKNPVEWAKKLESWGAGEILLQRVERDGMMNGYDLPLIQEIADAVSIPVIASCGAGIYHHMVEAVRAGASAVAAGSMFSFTDATPKGAADYLKAHGINARVA